MSRKVHRIGRMQQANLDSCIPGARVRRCLRGGSERMRVVPRGYRGTWKGKQQCASRLRHAVAASRFDIVVQYRCLPTCGTVPLIDDGLFNIAALKRLTCTPAAPAVQNARQLRRQFRAEARSVYFDGDNAAAMQLPEVAQRIGLYVKSLSIRSRRFCGHVFGGNNKLANHDVRTDGRLFQDHVIWHSRPLPSGLTGRVQLGCNVRLVDKFAGLSQSIESLCLLVRGKDMPRRTAAVSHAWIRAQRETAPGATESMEVGSPIVGRARLRLSSDVAAQLVR